MANDKILQLDENNFEEMTNGELPVLVDFWAPWCGPCRNVAPILDELADEHDGKILVGKVNVDENQALAAKYGVSGIPMFLLMQGGEVKANMVGAMPKKAFSKMLEKNEVI